MNNLAQSIREIVSASIVCDGKKDICGACPSLRTTDLVYAAINTGTVTLKKNAENQAEFTWIKEEF